MNTLSELPVPLRQALLTIPDKIATQANYEDAETLAKYAGLVPTTNEYKGFIADAMS